MSQHIQQQHHPHYVHYTPPTALSSPFTHVAPKDTQHQPQPQPQQQPQPQPQQPQQQPAQGSATTAPLVATGDWTKDLVHLAKTAELKCVFIIDVSFFVARIFNLTDPLIGVQLLQLIELIITSHLRKHALTLQLHTAHILSAHASLEQKGKVIQDLREQKNKCVVMKLLVISRKFNFFSNRLESERTRLLNCLREVSAYCFSFNNLALISFLFHA